jgi:hypothetical protein
LAVPRSIARSEENKLKTERKLYPFLLFIRVHSRTVTGRGPQVIRESRLRADSRSATE